jgi:hypothetical protein
MIFFLLSFDASDTLFQSSHLIIFRIFEFRKIISNRETASKLVPNDYPVEIVSETQTSDCKIIEGKFLTPLELYLPGLVPEAAKDAHFQMILPNKWKDDDCKPVCLHLAGTGDHVSLWSFL